MRQPIPTLLLAAIVAASVGMPARAQAPFADPADDWLVQPSRRPAVVRFDTARAEIELENGLVRRVLRLAPNAATVRFDDLTTGAALLRAVRPEARVQLDGRWFDVGGLAGQPNGAFLPEPWLDTLRADPSSFRYAGHVVSAPVAPIAWKRDRYAPPADWPPPGQVLTLRFQPPEVVEARYRGLEVAVHYQLYQGLPLLAKWITVVNGTDSTVTLNRFTSEVLALVEAESAVDDREAWLLPPLRVFSDYAFRGMDPVTSSQTTHWLPDPSYTTQVNYLLRTPALVESRPPLGPDARLAPADTFTSFRTYELLFDADDRERRGLAVRRAFRTLAPWATENPIFMHVRDADPAAVRLAIDQAADVGFEMVILTFGSGFDIERDDPAYTASIRELVDYAHSRGIELGGYGLLASRRVSDEHDVVDPVTGETGHAVFGNSPCLGSRWADGYFDRLRRFIADTGLDVFEHDGSYPGDVCAATHHPGHRGLLDSQWRQWERITDFYAWCRARGVYLNVPDFYFLNGSSKTGMGYRETNWSLPRDQQILHARQNIYDGTWEKTPSMGWMFVPLVEYHGGGAAATLEPLSAHLDAYEAHLANLFGAGVMAAYRGPRLYDTDATRAVVRRWVDFYKRHRAILDSDLIHLRRADGRDLDGWMHFNPALAERGLAVWFNPTDRPIRREVSLPLYYTGLTRRARLTGPDGRAQVLTLDRAFTARPTIEVPAHGVAWYVVEAP